MGAEMEARLSKALLPRVTPEHLQRIAAACCTDRSCVVKTVSHRRCPPPPLTSPPPPQLGAELLHNQVHPPTLL